MMLSWCAQPLNVIVGLLVMTWIWLRFWDPSKQQRWDLRTRLASLFTHHDRFNVHKTLGAICCVHYLYRFGRVFSTGTSGLTQLSAAELVLVIMLHAALSLSAQRFPVLRERLPSGRMILYHESLLHTMVFTLRSLAVMILAAAWPCRLAGNSRAIVVRAAVVISFHTLADIVSSKSGKRNSTLIRDMQWPAAVPSAFRWLIKKGYALAQLLAIAKLLRSDSYAIDMAFFIMWPIQLAAFLSTLVRKQLLSVLGWHVVYTLALVMVYRVGYPLQNHGDDGGLESIARRQWLSLGQVAIYVGRLVLRINKYILWAAFALLIYSAPL